MPSAAGLKLVSVKICMFTSCFQCVNVLIFFFFHKVEKIIDQKKKLSMQKFFAAPNRPPFFSLDQLWKLFRDNGPFKKSIKIIFLGGALYWCEIQT